MMHLLPLIVIDRSEDYFQIRFFQAYIHEDAHKTTGGFLFLFAHRMADPCFVFLMKRSFQTVSPGTPRLLYNQFPQGPVIEYIHPDRFEQYRLAGLEKGFKFVESSPLVRSSYHAERHVDSRIKAE